MPAQTNHIPENWRNYHAKNTINACKLSKNDLKTLYKIIDDKQVIYRQKILDGLSIWEGETPEAFEERKLKVKNAFVTSVTVEGDNGESVTFNTEQFFDTTNIPSIIKSVFFSTASVPKAVLDHLPENRVTAFLDFKQYSPFDFSKLPTFATPNETNFQIDATDESWFTLTNTKISEFFNLRKTGLNWIHLQSRYDLLLFFIGFPFAVWIDCRIGKIEGYDKLPMFLSTIIYVYAFFIALTIFRILFCYGRWLFPKVEMDSDTQKTSGAHRAIWSAIVLGVVIGFIYDAVKLCFEAIHI